MSTIAFIGLGIMGRPMAGHLIDPGHELYLFDISPIPEELLARGKKCRSSAEAASKAEIVITMVPDPPHVEAALFGKEGVAEGLRPGKLVIDMSSISLSDTKLF